jgi:hypothetical protein
MSWVLWAKRSLPMLVASSTGKLRLDRATLKSTALGWTGFMLPTDRLMALNTPGNRLEALKGDRKGQYSIRINDQWRVCFGWPDGSPGPLNVEIVDYH